MHAGDPEDLDTLRDETPEGWIVTGYPSAGLHTPDNDAFARAYQARYNEAPKMASVLGYTLIRSAAAMLRKAGGTGTDRLIAAGENLAFDSPFGRPSSAPSTTRRRSAPSWAGRRSATTAASSRVSAIATAPATCRTTPP